MRILIAHFDEHLSGKYAQTLWDYGWEVLTAHSGLECIAKLRRFRPDAFILSSDLLWGGSEGVIDWLRSEPALRMTPIILLADDWDAIRQRRDSAFRVDLVRLKPVTPDELYQLIRTFRESSLAM